MGGGGRGREGNGKGWEGGEREGEEGREGREEGKSERIQYIQQPLMTAKPSKLCPSSSLPFQCIVGHRLFPCPAQIPSPLERCTLPPGNERR